MKRRFKSAFKACQSAHRDPRMRRHCRRVFARRPRRKGLGEADSAHVGTVYIGRSVQKDGVTVRTLTKAEVEGIAGRLASFFGGGATVMQAEGLYKPPTGAVIKEPSSVVQVISSGGESCDRFVKRMHGAAARAAALAEQSSVIAVSVCDGGHVDAKLVTKTGGRDFPLPPVRSR